MTIGPRTGEPWTVPDLGMEFVPVAAGSFQMGRDDLGQRVHEVRITRPFWLGTYLVTQAEYERLMGCNPSQFNDDVVVKRGFLGFGSVTEKHARARCPVESVSWNDAVLFCKELTERERAGARLPGGYVYRLPTEAEWEYAALSRTDGRYTGMPAWAHMEEVTWHNGNSSDKTHPVGTKKPNELGLYDMSGNVSEWCLDWYGWDYYDSSPRDDPTGPSQGSGLDGRERVVRGGNWEFNLAGCIAWFRHYRKPTGATNSLGFRVALAPSVG